MHTRGLKAGNLFRIVGSAAVMFVLAACDGGSTEPGGPLSGTYDLTLVNGQSLPALYLTYGLYRSQKFVLDGTLEFSRRDHAADSRRLRDQPLDPGGLWSTFSYKTTGSYQSDGDRLIIQRPRFPGVSAAYADTGFINGDILLIPVQTIDGQGRQVHTLTYVRR